MSDLVEKLRAGGLCGDYGNMMGRKAADEIEYLRSFVGSEDLMSDFQTAGDMRKEIERLRDERLRSATEIMALRHLLDEFKKRLSDRTAEVMRLHKIIAE